jgi:hypothetical protein
LIRYQVDLLNRELSDVAPLLETITVRPPDSIEIRAFAKPGRRYSFRISSIL